MFRTSTIGACFAVPSTHQKFVPAHMDQTLEENGIVDDDVAFEKLGIDDDGYMPVLHIYFNDDLTIA
eukprot:g4516.t2